MGDPMFAWIFLMFAVILMAWVVSQVASGRIFRAAMDPDNVLHTERSIEQAFNWVER